MQDLVDEVGASRTAIANAKRDVGWQRGLVCIVVKSANNAFNDVASLPGRVLVAATRKPELLSGAQAASNQVARDTVELRQACDTTSTQSKELAKIEQWKVPIKILEDKIAFLKTTEESLKSELVMATMDNTRHCQLLDRTCIEVAGIHQPLAARDAVR